MRFIHAADIHFAARNPDPALKSLAKIAETAREREVDLIIIAGDLFDAPIRNSEADSMPALLDACGALLDAAPVVSVQGTPSHDAPGCYQPIVRMAGRRWQHIDAFMAGVPILLRQFKGDMVFNHYADSSLDGVGRHVAVVTGLPEPSRGWLAAGGLSNISPDDVAGKLRYVLGGIGAATHGRTVPHVHLQHGEVRGATLASGQVLPPGGIAVGTEDLALTGADYVALGHIHAQQRLTPRIHYAGSAYPVDWGERDPKSFAVIDLQGGDMDHRLVPYGHPARVKLELEAKDVARGLRASTEGIDAWFAIKVPADYSEHDATELRERVESDHEGFANSVRVTIERAARERVRVPEIKGQQWTDQAHAWATATKTPLGSAHGEIIENLEAESRQAGAIPQPRRWRIKSLRLRGAIGIWRGSGRDEISINLDAHDPGVIAVVGPNGAGKTTILENMTPWPSMLTRGGPLQQHFRLRDSVRELVIVDDETAEHYRCLIQIDAQSSRREQRVYSWESEGGFDSGAWEPLGADGSTAEYERVVDDLWGPRPLHMLSVVSPQKPVSLRVKGDDGEAITITTDLATASRGMLRALLRQLLGLGAYQAASRKAHLESQAQQDRATDRKHEAKRYDYDADRVDSAEGMAAGCGMESTNAKIRQRDAENALTERRADLESVAKAAAASREARARARSLDELVESEHMRLRQADEQIAKAVPSVMPGARTEEHLQNVVARYEQDDRRMAELRAAASDADNAWQAERERMGDQITDAVVERNEIHRRLCTAEDNKARAIKAIAELDMKPDTCSHCGQKLPHDALERIGALRVAFLGERDGETAAEAAEQQLLDAINGRHFDLVASLPERPVASTELTSLEASATARERALRKARTDLQRAQEWATKREALESERERLTERIAAAEQELLKAEAGMSLNAERDEAIAVEQVEGAVQWLADAGAAVKTADMVARHAREDLERCQTAATKRTELLDAAKGHEQRADAHRLVSTALGADGVQSLLLEHAAPRIAEIATDLLEQSYGARWRVRIELQRTGGAGAKRKVIEDVRFIVRDSESSESFGDDLDPGEQLLETLSGGESVWIKAALSEAIGAVRQERMDVAWRTVLRDEADAGLDEGAAASYWALVEAAHAMSGRHHTVAITHSGAQHAFTQRIEMGS